MKRSTTKMIAACLTAAAILASMSPAAASTSGPTTTGTLAAPVVGIAATPDGSGYWLTNAAGAVAASGSAVNYGSMAGATLNAPISHIVSTSDGKGYWLVAGDGGTFSFGDAGFFGSMGGQHLNAPVVDIAPTQDGKGYWLVASDGGVFAFGDAAFRGSMGGSHLNRPVVGISVDYQTGGYWMVASDGGIFAFGAPFFGSTGNLVLNRPIESMASTASGLGYWFVASDGGIFAFGDAPFYGSLGGQALSSPIVGMAANYSNGGYWMAAQDSSVYSFGPASKRSQAISFTSVNPSPTTVGAATYTPTATSTSGLGVTVSLDASSTGCAMNAGVVSFTSLGTCVVDANQAGDSNYDAAAQDQQSIAVELAQTISFASVNPSPTTVGAANYTPTATATSSLAVAFTLDGTSTGCSLTAGVVSFTGVGTCVVDANQGGNTTYAPAPRVQQSIVVGKGSQTISFTSVNPSPITVGAPTYTPTATATSSLAVAFTLDGTSTGCSLTAGVVSFTGVGTCVVDANQSGNANYNAASQQQSIVVNKGSQAIIFTSANPSPVSVGAPTYTPTTTGGASGNPVLVTLDGTSTGCTLTAGVISFTSTGTCVVDANQSGNANYNAAPQKQQAIVVGKADQTIAFDLLAPLIATFGDSPYDAGTFTSASSGLAVAFSADASSTGCDVSPTGLVTYTGAGTCVVDANQSGNASYNAAPQVQHTITIAKGSQIVTFTSTNPTPVKVGAPTYTPAATGGGSGNPVLFTVDPSSSAICSINGSGVVSFTGGGTCVIDANQSGSADYNAAEQGQRTITVG